jgi:DNA-binding LacI/PurR family transcriptional regulator
MPASTKSNRVEDYVRQQIVRGHWPAGAKVPSDAELSAQLDVSYMTVKTVLSRLAGEGLLHRKRRAGTHVSDGASCGNIGVVFRTESLQTMGSDYYRSMFERARDQIEVDGYRCVLAAGQGPSEAQFRKSTALFDIATIKRTTGVICFDASVNLDFCSETGIPVVYSTSAIPAKGEHCVFLDYEQMLNQGVSLLQGKGFDDFFLLTMDDTKGEFADSHSGRLQNLVHSIFGLPDDRIVWLPRGGYGCEGIYSSFRAWWSGLDRKPRALFFMDDAVCDIALRVIAELGIKVPEELAILTQAIVNRTFNFPVRLTCLEFSAVDVVDVTWRMLGDLIARKDGDKGVKLVKIPATLRMGDSLGS